MNRATATLSDYRQSPRKVRVVANLVRGKRAVDALITLEFADKRASLPLRKLVLSAIANAKALDLNADNLIIKEIQVNVGKTLHRRRPVAHGSAHPIHKRTSHVSVILTEGGAKKLRPIKARKIANKNPRPAKVTATKNN